MDTSASTPADLVPTKHRQSKRAGIVIGQRLRIPASATTLDGFRSWAHSPRFPQRGRITYLCGEVHVDMSPEEVRTHNAAKRDLIVDLTLETRRRNLGEVFIDGVLLVNEAADLATEPDLMFCHWETLQSGRAKLMEQQPGSGRHVELHGSPDLVVEIVSRSSVKKDKKDLREAYHRAGIPEYWIVDARKTVKFEVLSWQPAAYRPAVTDGTGGQLSQVLQAVVSISRTAVQLGGWRYKLQFA